MSKKYLWVQKGGGDFHVGRDLITDFDCVFNPQKITLVGDIPDKVSYSMEYFKYIPKDITVESGNGGFIMEYSDNIEYVRMKWYQMIVSHYNHLIWLRGLITLSPKWEEEMPQILKQSEIHKKEYPELWI